MLRMEGSGGSDLETGNSPDDSIYSAAEQRLFHPPYERPSATVGQETSGCVG